MTDRSDETRAVLLKTLGVEPGVSISLYEIGPPMAEKGFSEDRIVFALYDLKDEGTIDLTNGNRLVLLKPRA